MPVFLTRAGNCPQTAQLTYKKMKFGQFTYKIILSSHVNKDGVSQLYMQCFSNNTRRRIPLGILVTKDEWEPEKQCVKGRNQRTKDLNLLINETLSRAHEILVKYRLRDLLPSLDQFVQEFSTPYATSDFITYFEVSLKKRKAVLEPGTYKAQLTVFHKLRNFAPFLPFSQINSPFIESFKAYCRNVRKNENSTIFISKLFVLATHQRLIKNKKIPTLLWGSQI